MPPIPCPRCKTPMTQHAVSKKIICPKCDFVPIDRTAERIATAMNLPTSDDRHPSRLRGTRAAMAEKVHPRALTALESGQRLLKEGDRSQAEVAFRRAIEEQPDLLEAHLQLARLLGDLEAKARHLNTILDYFPRHEDTVQEIEQLLSASEAAPPLTNTRAMLQCPVCDNRLTADRITGEIRCNACGYLVPRSGSKTMTITGEIPKLKPLPDPRATATSTQTTPIPWNVGSQLLACQVCGLQRTLPARKLPAQCPVCGASQLAPVTVEGAYAQPELIVPFASTREQAATHLRQQASVLDAAPPKSVVMDALYVPVWLYHFIVTLSGTQRGATHTLEERSAQHSAALPLPLLNTLEFDWSAGVLYAARLLAEQPAAMQSIDMRAAANAAKATSEDRLYSRYGTLLDAAEKVRFGFARAGETLPALDHLTMRFKVERVQLALAPVWSAVLTPASGRPYRLLIQGQRGSQSVHERL